MKKEDIGQIVQFLSVMKDAVVKLEEAERRKDEKMFNSAKQEILEMQWNIKRLL